MIELHVIRGKSIRGYREVPRQHIPPLVRYTFGLCERILHYHEGLRVNLYLDIPHRKHTYGTYWNLYRRIDIYLADHTDSFNAYVLAHEFGHADQYATGKEFTKRDGEGYADHIAALIGAQAGFVVPAHRRAYHTWDMPGLQPYAAYAEERARIRAERALVRAYMRKQRAERAANGWRSLV